MSIPARKIELETTLDERAARLEANVEHMQKDIADMKIDIRQLGVKIDHLDHKLTTKIDDLDQKLTAKIDAVDQRLTTKIDDLDQRLTTKIDDLDQRLTGKIDSVKDTVSALAVTMERQFANVEKSFASLHAARAFDRVWWLLMSAALLGVMARAFKWL